ncbi:MAG TPA: ATP-binding protein [Rhodanobacteraceae bacterium]
MKSLPRHYRLAFRPTVAAAAVVLILIVSALTTSYQYRYSRTERLRQLRVQATVLAASVTAAVAFNDRKAAQEYVDALMLDPRVDAVAVFNDAHRRVAGFHRSGSEPIPDVTAGAQRIKQGYLLASALARQGTTTVGIVYLRSTPMPWSVRMARFSGVILLTLMSVLMLTLVTVAQTALTRVNAKLHRRAAELADANARLQEEMEQRLLTEAALHQSQKMETVGQLSGGIAHDFNNLLMVLKSSLALFGKRIRQDDDTIEQLAERARVAAHADASAAREVLNGVADLAMQRRTRQQQILRYLQTAQEGLDKAASLTQRLLGFARRQPLSPRPLELDALVRNIEPLLEHSVASGITIRYRLQSNWHVLCDSNQMENAIFNLVNNANDAMPAGGEITISTADMRAEAAQSDLDRALGDHVRLSVADTGVGMSEETRARAFDPFFTTKPVGKGTGLGLSTILGYVMQSDGRISIDSQPGHGTVVHIDMPRAHAHIATETA